VGEGRLSYFGHVWKRIKSIEGNPLSNDLKACTNKANALQTTMLTNPFVQLYESLILFHLIFHMRIASLHYPKSSSITNMCQSIVDIRNKIFFLDDAKNPKFTF